MNYFLPILVTLLFSAFFSGMEIAFISANKLRIELDKKRKVFPAGIISLFSNNPSQYIATMLVGNNIALVAYGILMAMVLEPLIALYVQSDAGMLAIKTILSTLLILITAEFLPKTLFRINPNSALNFFSVPLVFFYFLFFPITWFSIFITNTFFKSIFKVDLSENNEPTVFEKVDLANFLNEATSEDIQGEELEHEIRIFQNALEFSSLKVRDCMIPRTEIVAMDVTSNQTELLERFVQTGLSKIIIYEDNIDNVLGYINAKRLFSNPENLKENLKPLSIVPETMQANKLLKKFIQEHKSIALIVDEFGGTSGLITLEDIIEEIFGEIQDEHDYVELTEKKISELEYIFSGRIEIDYLNEKYALNIPDSEDYETLAGYILHYHENIPDLNQLILISGFEFRVLKMNNTRIELVHLKIILD